MLDCLRADSFWVLRRLGKEDHYPCVGTSYIEGTLLTELAFTRACYITSHSGILATKWRCGSPSSMLAVCSLEQSVVFSHTGSAS